MKVKNIVTSLGSWLYPDVCLCCLDDGIDGLDLCRRCHADLPYIEHACEVCALPLLQKDIQRCGACSRKEKKFRHAHVPFLYENFIRTSIHHYKFNHKLNYGMLLAQLLVKHIEHNNIPVPDVLIPVPLHKKKIKQRGFNQALEISKIMAKYFGCRVLSKDFNRIRETKPQLELPASKRRANVKNAFKMSDAVDVSGIKHAVLVDDVMTTGSTVNELAKCVKASGIEQVDVWCVARVV